MCDLIEKKRPPGLIQIMDDMCVASANASDERLLGRYHQQFGGHKHYEKPKFSGPNFVVKHYAGDVTYCINGFLDTNKDTLFNDLIDLCTKSTSDAFLQHLFEDKRTTDQKRHRPPTAGAAFRTSVQGLMRALTHGTSPHYVRCIKPNEVKKFGVVNDKRVHHQVRYLGLVENIRVRRAGFCFRATYGRFLKRYKMLSPRTWPTSAKAPKDQVHDLLTDQDSVFWYPDPRFQSGAVGGEKEFFAHGDQFQLGKTKAFIRAPMALFGLERLRVQALPAIVTKLTALWRMHAARKRFLRTLFVIHVLQASYKAHLGRKAYLVTRRACCRLQAAHRGLKHRRQMPAEQYETCKLAKMTMMAAFNKFMGEKSRRRYSLMFEPKGDYLRLATNPKVLQQLARDNETMVHFGDHVDKINRKMATQQRILLVTDRFIYNLKPSDCKAQRKIAIASLTQLSLSTQIDNYFVMHVDPSKDRGGNYFFVSDRKIELINVLRERYRWNTKQGLPVKFSDKFNCSIGKGSGKTIRLNFAKRDAGFFAQSGLPQKTFHKAAGTVVTINVAPEVVRKAGGAPPGAPAR